MKKYVCLFICLFFIMCSNVHAAYFGDVSVNMVVHDDGSATVSTSLILNKQKSTRFEYDFMNTKGAEISNLSITDDMNAHFEKVDSLESGKYFFYKYVDQGYKKFIVFNTVQKASIVYITFDISNVTFEYSDGTYGIDWFILSRIAGEDSGSASLKISFDDETIIQKVNKVYTFGVKSGSCGVSDTAIEFKGSNIDSGVNFRALVNFKSGVSFENATKKDNTFAEYYDDVLNGRDFVTFFYSNTSRGFLIGFAVAIEVAIVILLLSYIIIKYGIHDEYYGMETVNKKTVQKPKQIPYYDSVPCQGDLYKIFFVAGYFKILKSKSGLIGAILFKMYLNDNVELINGKNGYDLIMKNDLKIDRSLDQDLYNILMEMSDMRVVNFSRSNRFAKKHFLRLMTWYNMGYSETITDEINRAHATRGGKIGKTTKIVFNEDFVDYGNKIIGMKKYLLNFNQVPRQTALSEDTYKLLLICAEMLGIGEQVANEILRKNSNNIYARKLLEFQRIKVIYKDLYSLALVEYRKTVKNGEIYNYDSMKDSSMSSTTNVISYKG